MSVPLACVQCTSHACYPLALTLKGLFLFRWCKAELSCACSLLMKWVCACCWVLEGIFSKQVPPFYLITSVRWFQLIADVISKIEFAFSCRADKEILLLLDLPEQVRRARFVREVHVHNGSLRGSHLVYLELHLPRSQKESLQTPLLLRLLSRLTNVSPCTKEASANRRTCAWRNGPGGGINCTDLIWVSNLDHRIFIWGNHLKGETNEGICLSQLTSSHSPGLH